MKSVILLSGPIGAGKTTVARQLIASSPHPVAYIEGDTFWSFIAKKADGVPRHKNFKMIMMAMVAAALPYALYGYETILDFSLPPWFLETAEKILGNKDIPADYVVLRPTEPVCAARAAGRAEGVIPDYAVYHDFYAEFGQAGRRHLICDDTTDAVAMAALIREGLAEGRFRLL